MHAEREQEPRCGNRKETKVCHNFPIKSKEKDKKVVFCYSGILPSRDTYLWVTYIKFTKVFFLKKKVEIWN